MYFKGNINDKLAKKTILFFNTFVLKVSFPNLIKTMNLSKYNLPKIEEKTYFYFISSRLFCNIRLYCFFIFF